MMGARIVEDCEKYLGLPMASGQSKVNTFKDLQEKITKRVMGWKEKFISKAGMGNLNQDSSSSHTNMLHEHF